MFKVYLSYLKMTISIAVASLNSPWVNTEICLIHIVLHFILHWPNNHHFEVNAVRLTDCSYTASLQIGIINHWHVF